MTRNRKHTFAAALTGLIAIGSTGIAAAQAQDAATRYADTLAKADITARYNRQIEQQLRSQEAEIASLEQQIAGLDQTALDLQPMLQRMFDDLERFVQNDLPFLEQERTERLNRIRDLMANVEASTSEKFRRIMEAYTIEMEYGRTMEAYKQTLSDGREADMVRLGRVTLLYRTVDGTESGYWDHQQKAWVPDRDSARRIEEALRMAREETAPDLIVVPVPAAQGGRS